MARYRVGLRTRERILGATRELLGEVGFEATTLKAITDRAGVGAGSFYNLFEGKDQAVLEVIREAINAVDPDPSGLGTESIKDLVGAFVTFFTAEETLDVARIHLQLASQGINNDALMSAVLRSHRKRVKRFTEAIHREDDTVAPDEARAHAEFLLAALLGFAATSMLDPSFDIEANAVRLSLVPNRA